MNKKFYSIIFALFCLSIHASAVVSQQKKNSFMPTNQAVRFFQWAGQNNTRQQLMNLWTKYKTTAGVSAVGALWVVTVYSTLSSQHAKDVIRKCLEEQDHVWTTYPIN